MKGYWFIIFVVSIVISSCTTDNYQDDCKRPIGIVSYKNPAGEHNFLFLTKYCEDPNAESSSSFSDLRAGESIENDGLNIATYKIYSDATNSKEGIEISEAFQKGQNSPLTEADYANHNFVVEMRLEDGRNNLSNPFFNETNSEYFLIDPSADGSVNNGGISLDQLKAWTNADKFDFSGTSIILNGEWDSPNYLYASLESMEDPGGAVEWVVAVENEKPLIYYAKNNAGVYEENLDRQIDESDPTWFYLIDNSYTFMKGDIIKYYHGDMISDKEKDFLPEDRNKKFVFGKYIFSNDNNTLTISSIDGLDPNGNINPFEENAQILQLDNFEKPFEQRRTRLLLTYKENDQSFPEENKRVIVTLRPFTPVTVDEFYK